MYRPFVPYQNSFNSHSFSELCQPLKDIIPNAPQLISKGHRPLKMTFEDQLNSLIFFHLEEHKSARQLVQTLKEDDFARENIAPNKGISRSSFSEAINSRGLEQLNYIFKTLSKKASKIIPEEYSELGDLVAIDGSLIDAVSSMVWADYRTHSKKAKVHLGFNINQKIPSEIFLTKGKEAERPFVLDLLLPGQTGVCDRGYQYHTLFDKIHNEGKFYAIRIKEGTTITCLLEHKIDPHSFVFYDAEVLLGSAKNKNQTQEPVRLVGYRVAGVDYWIATNRRDLTAEQVAKVYELRWRIESFFAWWKRHLKVYHLIARSQYGLMVQILAGLITFLLLAIYCHKKHGEQVNIKRVRQLRIKIHNEIRKSGNLNITITIIKEQKSHKGYAKT